MSTFYIEYAGKKIYFGTMTNMSQSFNKAVSTTPIVSKSAQNAFQIETGSTMTYSLSFTRKDPEDDNEMSNEMWYHSVTALIDRWQARTNGCTLTIEGGEGGYVPSISVNGYVKSISRKYSTTCNDTISGTVEFTVGTMYVNKTRDWYNQKDIKDLMIQRRDVDSYNVLMSDTSGMNWYALLLYNKDASYTGSAEDIRCVESYELVGGIEQPFEYLTLNVSKKALATVAPYLVGENKILAGKNKIRINAVGTCMNMTVTKCKLNGDIYTITAYCDAEKLKGYTVDYDNTGRVVVATPFAAIKYFLEGGLYGVTYTVASDTLITNVADKTYRLYFDSTVKVWVALQMCALALNAKIFFIGNKAYVMDCTVSKNKYIDDIEELKLDETDPNKEMFARVSGDVSLGNEGMDTIVNIVTAKCKSGNASYGKVTVKDSDSVTAYGRRDIGEVILCDTDDVQGTGNNFCTDVANTYLNYRKAPQQSITFEVKELSAYADGGGFMWEQLFAPITRVGKITDDKDDITISKVKLGSDLPQSLMMTGYTRHYPEGTSTYEFGVISNVDLAESTSQILTAQGTK